MFDDLKNTSIKHLLRLYKQGNRLTKGWIGILRAAIMSFSDARASEAAASIAYYTFFSIFPLLILLVALGSFFLEGDQVQAQIAMWVNVIFPPAADLVAQNLEQVISQRSVASMTGVIGLLWAGLAAFMALSRNINRAWPKAKPRNFLTGRLVALAMVGVIVILLLSSIILTTVVRVSAVFELSLFGGQLMGSALSWFTTFIMFASLYRWLPNTSVLWSEAAWGALAATIGWQTAVVGFTWYLSSGLAKYQLVYGALSTVIVMLLWIYISALIALFGAHLSAAVCRKRRRAKNR